MEVKDILKNRRIEKHLTLEEVGRMVGVSAATISRWESGEISIMKRDKIVNLALERKTGARGLRAIMEDVMMDAMYEVPSNKNITKCVITAGVVDKKVKPAYEIKK